MLFTAPTKEGNRNLESVSFGSGVKSDLCGECIGKQKIFKKI